MERKDDEHRPPVSSFASFADYLLSRKGRRKNGQIATYLRVSGSTVSRWMHGTRPEPHNIVQLADYFDDDPREILSLLPDPLDTGARRAPSEAEPPPWAQRLIDDNEQLKAGIASLRTAHAGPTAVAPAESVRPLLEAAGYRGLLPVEVTTDDLRDREPAVLAGMIVWLDPLMSPSPGCVVGVQLGDELVLRSVDADGVTLRSAVPGRPPLRLDQVDRVVGVGRLAQSPL